MLKPKKRLLKAKAEEDKLTTFLKNSRNILDQYGQWILYGLVGVVVVIAISLVLQRNNSSTESEAAFDELLIRDAYSRGQMDEALIKAEEVIADYAGTQSAGIALSVKARIHEQRGESEHAIQAYNKLVDGYSDLPYLAFGGYYSLGIIYSGQGDYEKASLNYRLGAQKYPDHFNAAVCLVEAGRALKKINRYDEAKRLFQEALDKYPKSRAISTARNDLAEIEFMP
jgi:tetratricopeptide (TPR) repeat protein